VDFLNVAVMYLEAQSSKFFFHLRHFVTPPPAEDKIHTSRFTLHLQETRPTPCDLLFGVLILTRCLRLIHGVEVKFSQVFMISSGQVGAAPRAVRRSGTFWGTRPTNTLSNYNNTQPDDEVISGPAGNFLNYFPQN
jgi:hypothetical protein